MDALIETRSLTQGYRDRTIIDGLDFSLSPGITGLLGPNGAGKTTFMASLACVLPPQKGEVVVLGRSVRTTRDARWARRHIGYLPQRFGYHSGFTVAEFLTYCAWLHLVPRTRYAQAVADVIERVGLTEQRNRKMGQLSGGMLRRACIAQALIADPPVLLMDEPTVGLDPEQRLTFRDLLRGLLPERAVLVSTHLVEDVAALDGGVAVMKDGAIVYRGSVQELARQGAPGGRGDTPLESGYLAVLSREPSPL